MKQQNLFETAPAPWEADAAEDRTFATVVLSEAPYGPYDYLIPEVLRARVEPGKRVRVPLGQGNRAVVAYCVKTRVPGGGDEATAVKRHWKEIRSVVDAQPLLTSAMLRLTEWMSEHYLCPWGQVLEAVVPTGVRIQAGTRKVALLSVPGEVRARLAELKLPARQAEILSALAASAEPVPLPDLLARMKCTTSPIRGLERKGLIKSETGRVYQRVPQGPAFGQDRLQLNADQRQAMEAILAAINSRRFETLLVHGVTGSGKTELYMQAIEQVIHFGRQAIVLVPEISLTPQTVARFRSRFPHVAVLHSHLSAPERNWQWQQIAAGRIQVVVGARSAIFAPTPHLGLIVLDEEHDASFKQDIAPRYHARDVALQRARMENIPVVLGSATPSVETWHRAHEGEFRLVELPRRILDLPMPDVSLIDLRTDARNRFTRGAISRPLHNAMNVALSEEGQVILLLNRRGYSTTIQCPACGLVVMCPDCEMALTHHRTEAIAACHYCDYQIPAPPPACPECAFEGIRYSGLGTERLEAEVKRRFPEASCLRMDSDSMRTPGSHERAFQQFRDGEVQILVGTQMIAKGLDFPNVTLVGVINADVALHFPDFRAAERTFQLVTQVAGRTGRGPRGGRVLVQTYSPDHPAILAAVRHDYHRFAQGEMPVRRDHGYPPFSALIRLIVRGPVEDTAEQFAHDLTARIRSTAASRQFEPRILGPAPAPIAKLRGKFRYHLLLMSGDAAGLRDVVRSATHDLKAPDEVLWTADVDPVDML